MSSCFVPLWKRLVETQYANVDNFAFCAHAYKAVPNAIKFIILADLHEVHSFPHAFFKQAYHNGHNRVNLCIKIL